MIQKILRTCVWVFLLIVPSGIHAAPEKGGMEQRMRQLLDISQSEPARAQAWETLQRMSRVEIEDPYRHIYTGAVQTDEPILVLEPGRKAVPSFGEFTTATWMRFQKRDELILADLHFFHASWPQTRWVIEMELLDAQGETISRESQSFENSGVVEGIPCVGREKISLTFPKLPEKADSEAVRYRLAIHAIWTRKSNPFQPDGEIPVDLSLNAPRISIHHLTVRTNPSSPTLQVHVSNENWPATSYTLTLKLLNAQGGTVAETEKEMA
ncbi:MAG TPA: hypothetical protein PLA90_18670, partial [Candidatus Sumerlaeota bacterium]|nr:hypothetical protein [Candidatus Sumerlaeota bacterium]